jgi:hypothetical protein
MRRFSKVEDIHIQRKAQSRLFLMHGTRYE